MAARLCVGVDLGTTYSVVAVWRKGKVDVIANDSGSRTTPSVVAFMDGEAFVGDAAKDLPQECRVYDAKRLLGCSAGDAAVRDDAKDWPFEVLQDGGVLKMKVARGGKTLTPQEVSSMVMKFLKEAAEMFMDEPVPCAVITVPPYFTEPQRKATREAGAAAGFQVLGMPDEAEAAVTAYGLAGKTVLVLHIGGRSQYAWVRPHGGEAATRHAAWGGSLFDQRLLEHFENDIRQKHGVQQLDPQSLEELLALCETTKRKLSALQEVAVRVYLQQPNLEYKATINRARFENLCADLFGKVQDLMEGALAAAKVTAVDEVVLVGGSTRMPRVRSMVREAYSEPRVSVNPDEAVAHGAALHAARLSGEVPANTGVVLVDAEVHQRTETVQRDGAGPSGAGPRNPPPPPKSRTKGADGPAIGIDLGTTYSVVAVWRKGKVDVMANESGSRTTPSVVAFMDGEAFVGDAAKDLPASTRVFDAKRLIGRSWEDMDVQQDLKHWPFQVVEEGGVPKIVVDAAGRKESFTPEEVSAMVLRSLKETAENFLGCPVTRAVVTVPAYFNEKQRQATKSAGMIAGLNVLSIINEPTAAALAYGLTKSPAQQKTVFIFDLGGGTFDVSVLTIRGNDFTVLASDGDTHLGGQDFDVRMMEHFLNDIKTRLGISDLDQQSVQDLRALCELSKRKLSSLHEASAKLYLPRHNTNYTASMTRARFEDLCGDLFRRTMDITNRVLAEARVSHADIDEVVLVGGSTRIPKVRAMLSELFGGKELRHSVNPDEAVAYGAAVHAAILSGDKTVEKLVKLKDVTPLSLGVEVVGGVFSALIRKNSPIPVKNTKRFSTVQDNQIQCGSFVYQGERTFVKDNHCLKEFTVDVPPRPAGLATIDVTFEIDLDGCLIVTAVEPTTMKQAQVKISSVESRLSDQDIHEMLEKAKRYQRQDDEELRRLEELLRNRQEL
ncbi:heat shock 70 kDa protein-like [Thrips palmi]|uniref:Heat shock 70 kDa protein-like n=1 Tax=Thrips palmi TaxID=161013 RepID=A0A6P8Z9R5_THRPL|nr:heat shock 70 kDa protein-like [Thrips palmi]XP_034247241.1 heat shock 70 kDa protein-like [Thrips palmi]XP_034247242.1 heat shock 70 kDa protein-like [Thrips palmi]XP_034247243.1 heat shock 70 kDa protein-like [Thrips palmi]XP_034247244.1 heat shock 70 kDa protein-like [Thrips palmi]XP_034247245.1 heat shock 70 kDa protein-like [Thrips palmi]XP_034247246.1 heat shock 70 kDa protein-like [Thrips palmi]XP_034247247.1 heat shock 70 kDa protein-like [Thrips palmi]XP_034247248.1 heat shock 7